MAKKSMGKPITRRNKSGCHAAKKKNAIATLMPMVKKIPGQGGLFLKKPSPLDLSAKTFD
jgi:hypothetical protein